jgi:hypothetical protein
MTDFDAQKFKSGWWSSSPLSYDMEHCISLSYDRPQFFWSSLWSLHPSPSKSSLGKHYDIYSDCILRHPESHIAFSLIEEGGFITSWSYKKLHRCVNYLLKKWGKQPLKPHSVVAIIMNPGIDYLVALLAALRLGLIICYLPSSSPLLSEKTTQDLLEQIKPSFTITKNILPNFPYSTLLVEELGESDDAALPEPHSYPAAQTLQISLALTRKEPFTLIPLSAETTYLHALRDGLLTLNLQSETTWANPLSSPILAEPFHSLSALLSGANLMHVSDALLHQDPLILKDKKIQVLGISKELLNLWSQYPGCPSKSLKCCYISPFERALPLWNTFTHLNELDKVPCFQAWTDNSSGGFMLISKPFSSEPYLKPSLGSPWLLMDVSSAGTPSQTGFGRFLPLASPKETNAILSHIHQDVLITATDDPAKEGISLPLHHIEQSLRTLPFIQECAICPIPQPSLLADTKLIFLIFIDPLKNDIADKTKQEWTHAIHTHITQGFGPFFLPDAIEYFCLIPKKTGAHIDKAWCFTQYTSGLLTKKNRLQVYQLLSMLKKLSQDMLKDV